MASRNFIQITLLIVFYTLFNFINPTTVKAQSTDYYVDGSVEVSGDGLTPETAFKTISEIYAVTKNPGTTIHVAPGVYQEYVVLGAGISLNGAGYQSTIIDGGNSLSPVIYMVGSSRLSNVQVRGSSMTDAQASGIKVGGSNVVISNTQVADNNVGILIHCNKCKNITVTNSLIAHNMRDAVYVTLPAEVAFNHNTVVKNGYGYNLRYASISTIENNIIAYNTGMGILCFSSCNIRNNLFWLTKFNGDEIPGQNSIVQDPLFRNVDTKDFRLSAASPARNIGSPISDLGAIPFISKGLPPNQLVLEKISDYKYIARWASTNFAYRLYIGNKLNSYNQALDLNQTEYIFSNISSNPYFIAISSLDENGIESSNLVTSSFEIPEAKQGIHEETSPALVLRGNWQIINDSRASSGAYLTNTSRGAELEITFIGDSISFLRMINPNGRTATYYIDEFEDNGMELSFKGAEKWQVPAVIEGIENSRHVLLLTTGQENSVYIDSIILPGVVISSVQQQLVLNRVNYHRTITGLGLVQLNSAINLAAQSHADFYITNFSDPRLAGLGAHEEFPDLPGFTGEHAWDRATFFGYRGNVAEVIAGGDPIRAVDSWMETVYHRNPVLGYGNTEIGYGTANKGQLNASVMNLGSQPSRRVTIPGERVIYTYPANGQMNVPLAFTGGEIPNPLPGVKYPVGYSISMYLLPVSGSYDPANWSVSIAELKDASGQLVSSYLLTNSTDPHHMLGSDVIFLIPKSPLQPKSTYSVHMSGTDSLGSNFDYSWAFTTVSNLQNTHVATKFGSTPSFPKVGEEITIQVELMNDGQTATSVQILAGIPQYSTYVPNSATISQGNVIQGSGLTFNLGLVEEGAIIKMSYKITPDVTLTKPVALNAPITITWDGGSLQQTITTIVNGQAIYMPFVSR